MFPIHCNGDLRNICFQCHCIKAVVVLVLKHFVELLTRSLFVSNSSFDEFSAILFFAGTLKFTHLWVAAVVCSGQGIQYGGGRCKSVSVLESRTSEPFVASVQFCVW